LQVFALSASESLVAHAHLSVILFPNSRDLARSLSQRLLQRERCLVTVPESDAAFFQMIERQKQQLDCIVLQDSPKLRHLINWLHSQATLLPTVILQADASLELQEPLQTELTFLYHTAEIWLPLQETDQIADAIDRAIAAFLKLSPMCQLPSSDHPADPTHDLNTQNFLMLQQRRLSEKLKERLGYLGVYYKRNPDNFLRNLSSEERSRFLRQLKTDYRDIILNYFSDTRDLNQKIDNFVNAAFFADISVSQIVETHMELMDEFSKQLKLEGRSEEVLLDYRLTLIDTIAHLCEMYRRSIPRES
jgi:circadian clock protein KaiA